MSGHSEISLALGALQSEVAGAREDIRDLKATVEPRIRSLETTRSRIQGWGSAVAAGVTIFGMWIGLRP